MSNTGPFFFFFSVSLTPSAAEQQAPFSTHPILRGRLLHLIYQHTVNFDSQETLPLAISPKHFLRIPVATALFILSAFLA